MMVVFMVVAQEPCMLDYDPVVTLRLRCHTFTIWQHADLAAVPRTSVSKQGKQGILYASKSIAL